MAEERNPHVLRGMYHGEVSPNGHLVRFGFSTGDGDLILQANIKSLEEIIIRLQVLAAQALGQRAATGEAGPRPDRPQVRVLMGSVPDHAVVEASWAGRAPVSIPLDRAGLDTLIEALGAARAQLGPRSAGRRLN